MLKYRYLITALLFFLLMITASARAAGVTGTGTIIDSVEIDNRNIYDLTDPRYSHWIFRLANKCNIKTRKSVIRRELLLRKGDTYRPELAEETEYILRALPYIWNASVDLDKSPAGANVLRVTTSDRWSLTGGFSFSRSAAQTTYQLGFEEVNFLGLGQFLEANYFIREFEEDYLNLAYSNRRILGSNLALDTYYNDSPEVGSKRIVLSKPWYSLLSKFSFIVAFKLTDRRNDYYMDGVIVGQDWVRGSIFDSKLAYRFGSYHTKLETGLLYSYVDFDARGRREYYADTPIHFARDSLYHFVEPQIGIMDIRFIKTWRIRMFTRDEDITLTRSIFLKYGRAWNPAAGRKVFDKISLEGSYAVYYRSNLILANLIRREWFDGARSFRKQQELSIRYYNNGTVWYTPVVLLMYAKDVRRDRMKFLYLGENHGIRGYSKNYRDGEKLVRCNLENRFFTNIRLISNRIGITQFADFGRVWSQGEKLDFTNWLWSVGIGLRFGTERVTKRETLRIDLAYAGRLKSWQISFGLGQYIN
ncbi:MAG: BamA/TamA family outer membrane protein [Candidatus Zixiibacteriota bacterium]|nr:MAG: BamA/TamA family outer membrane protein [candidate division Zixibacteria bacterium]